MKINPAIFRAYDIRGEVQKTLTSEVAEAIGLAFGSHIRSQGGKQVSVSRDNRESSRELATNFIRGVLSTGVNVIDLGLTTSPMLYFSIIKLDLDGGAIITASHGTAAYNGIKLCKKYALHIFEEELKEIQKLIETDGFVSGKGELEKRDIFDEYEADILQRVSLKRDLKVAVDCGDGAAGPFAPDVLEKLGCRIFRYACRPVGDFPHGGADPTEKNLKDLSEIVTTRGYDVGIGLDPDGDRLGVVDEEGNYISIEKIAFLLAKDLKTRGSKFACDVRSLLGFKTAIERLGGEVEVLPTGRSFFRQKLYEDPNILLGVEASGHIHLNDDFYGFDDATFAAVRLLEILSKSRKPLSKLVAEFPKTVTKKTKISKTIFRESDIRGVTGVDFEPEMIAEYEKWHGKFPGANIDVDTSRAIGMAYGTHIKRLGGSTVVVGYEVRPYADELKESFINGVLETGIDVVYVGKTTTPFIYFLTSYQDYDGGVNITGSHNVYFFNGFKMTKRNTDPLYGQELLGLYQLIVNENFDISPKKGSVTNLNNGYEIYKKYILEHIRLGRRLDVVVDCGNGTPGLFAVDFLEGLGCNVVKGLYLEPNAYFPNHIPDPESPMSMRDLSKAVVKKGADVGVAFDADGDRVGFVDEEGTFISADDILLLLSRDVLSGNKGKKVLYDVKCSQLLEEMIPQFGGVPVMHKTGHGAIKDTLRKDSDVVFGGEESGHFYFVENYFKFDDGFYAAAEVLRLLSESGGSFSNLLSFIPKRIRTPEIKLPCADEVKIEVVRKTTENLSKKYKAIIIDGVRITFDDKSWGVVRASDTAPHLTVRVEGLSEKQVLAVKGILADELEKHPEIKEGLDRRNVASYTGVLGYV